MIFTVSAKAQKTTKADNEKITGRVKTGWTFVPLPSIAFDTDVGFQYGALANFYYYGNGSTYPEYLHSIYIEWSRTTRGSGINRLYYDSKYLIPGIRLTADASYLTEQAMQFYGFNGYDAVYNPEWENEDSPEYRSRLFYRHDRRIFRIMANFQGNLLKSTRDFKWITGFAFYRNKIGSVDIDKLNQGRDASDTLPHIDGLYDRYVKWGVITPAEASGNTITYFKAGLVYDTRDTEPNPFKGIWTEAVISYSPGFPGDSRFAYAKFTFIHRQYFTILPEILSFAYRLGYQGTLFGNVPFHMQPHIVPTYLTAATSQGLGGSKTLRGIQRNRIVGDGIVFGNFEFRWKFLRTSVLNQNVYLGTNLFLDAGEIVKKIEVDLSQAVKESDVAEYFDPGAEKIHFSTGIGLKVAVNENFILSFDWGKALDPRDGDTEFYITLNYLF